MKGKDRTYVLDTSVLINDPDIFYKLGDSDIVIPSVVIKEIDGIKRNPDPEEPRGSSQDISVGARTSVSSTVRICTRYATIDDLASNADNRIVGTAIMLKEESVSKVTLLSADSNMRNVTRAHGIKAENYPRGMEARENEYFKNSGSMRDRMLLPDTRMTRNIIIVTVVAILFVLLLSSR